MASLTINLSRENASGSNCTCYPISSLKPEIVDQLWAKVVFSCIYGIIMLAGLTGNSMVVYSILFRNINFSVKTAFILNLSITDFFLSLASLPITGIGAFSRIWILGHVICTYAAWFQGICVFSASFTLVVIAIYRYIKVVHFKSSIEINGKTAVVVILLIWALSMTLASPLVTFSGLRTFSGVCGVFCGENWPSPRQRLTYGFSTLFLQYGIPSLITSYCYGQIARIVKRQTQKRCSLESMASGKQRQLHLRTAYTNRMVCSMVISFTITWLPLNVINLIRDFGINLKSDLILVICHQIAMLSTICNPIIYSWYNPEFRCILKTVTCVPMPEHATGTSNQGTRNEQYDLLMKPSNAVIYSSTSRNNDPV